MSAPAEIEFGAFFAYNMTFGGSNFTNYRAMHCGAKRSIALAYRTSVRLSVCNVGRSGANTMEILETDCTDNPNTLVFLAPKVIHLLPGNMRKF